MESEEKNTTEIVYKNILQDFINGLERSKDYRIDLIADKYYPLDKPEIEFIEMGRRAAIKDITRLYTNLINSL